MFESLLLASFVAGFLTVLAPCLLPLLPVVIGGTFASENNIKRGPYLVIASLLVSIIIFTLIIEFTSSFIYIPTEFWHYFAGILVLFVGLTFLFPSVWSGALISRFSVWSNKLLGKNIKRSGAVGDILIGSSLGPVFSACSPTYLLIIAIILPSGFFEGLLYLFAYVLGLGVVLLFIALLGQTAVEKLRILSKEKGYFKITLGIVMIIIAVAIFTGFDKKFGTFLFDAGFFDATQLEIDVRG